MKLEKVEKVEIDERGVHTYKEEKNDAEGKKQWEVFSFCFHEQ